MSDRIVKLAELVDANHLEISAGRPRSVNLARYPIPILRVADVLDGKIESSHQGSFSGASAQELGPKVSRVGDVVLTTKGTVGRVVIMSPGSPLFAYSPQLCYFRAEPDGPLRARYLYYWFKSADFWNQANVLKGQTDMADFLSLRDIYSLKMRLPSLADQTGIAVALGALDDKIAVNERIAATADELTHALFAQRFLAGVDCRRESGWRSGRLSDICVTQYGYTASSSPEPIGPKFLRVKDINKRNWVDWYDVPYCEIDRAGNEKYSVSVGDILVARMADPGKSAIVEESVNAVFASYLVRLKTESLAHSYFLWGFLKSAAYERYVASSRGGSVQANMNAKVIVAAELDIPPMDRMEEYYRQVEPLRTRLNSALRETRTLATLRDTLLPQLMSGRIRVKDAEKIVEDHV